MTCHTYEARDRTLLAMGFSSYREYLASDLWAGIREQVRARCHYRCRMCKGRATQVHHLSYTRPVLEGKDPQQLIALCGRCHKKVEFDPKTGCKLTVEEMRVRFGYTANVKTVPTRVAIGIAKGRKCPKCWNWLSKRNPTVCKSCLKPSSFLPPGKRPADLLQR